MTTIATDGKTVAADSMMVYGNEVAAGEVRKMLVATYHAKHGEKKTALFAFSGAHAMFQSVVDWYREGADPKRVPPAGDGEWGMIVVHHDRMTSVWSSCPYECEAHPPFAIGSGSDYALGAMHHGASAGEAVMIAAKLDRSTGGTINSVVIADALRKPLAEAAE